MTMRRRTFAARVCAWHRAHGRHDLPWQNTRDAYRIWLSEVMLQQTQVATVLPYYERFVAEFPEVRALAAAPLQRVLELWSGLGYYRRAHHLHAAAQAVVGTHGGAFPTTAHALATLPGIGRSTAAAIAAFASGERGAILDGNVKRVLARHRGIFGFAGEPSIAARFWEAAESLLPPSADIAIYTQAMMDLGATVCERSQPRCDHCPVAQDCIARLQGRIAELPTPRPRKSLPQRAIRLVVISHGDDVLLEKRPNVGIWSGLWSLPEVPLDADVAANLQRRFNLTVEIGNDLPLLTHTFTHFALTMHPRRARVMRLPAQAEESRLVWLPRAAIVTAALPSPIRRLLRSLDPM